MKRRLNPLTRWFTIAMLFALSVASCGAQEPSKEIRCEGGVLDPRAVLLSSDENPGIWESVVLSEYTVGGIDPITDVWPLSHNKGNVRYHDQTIWWKYIIDTLVSVEGYGEWIEASRESTTPVMEEAGYTSYVTKSHPPGSRVLSPDGEQEVCVGMSPEGETQVFVR